MDDRTAFERQVGDEIFRIVGPARPVDDRAVFEAAATQSPKWRLKSMFSATEFVVAGVIVALFGGFLLAGVLTQPGEEAVPAVGASASASPEPAPVVTDAFDVGGYLDSLVGSHGAIWVAGGDGPVRRIDPVTREVTEAVPAGSGIRHLVPTADAVWAVGRSLMRIDPASAEVTDTLPLVAESLWPPPVADGSIWIGGDGVLYEVDIESRELVNEYVGHGGGWSGVIDRAIWLWGGEQGLVRFDLDTREFSDPFPVPALDWGYEHCCVVAEDAIWLIAGPGEFAMRFDLSTFEITDTIDLRRSGSTYPDEGIAVADAVWIPHGDGVVYRIDAQSREITDTVTVDGRPLDRIVFVDGAIWVASWDTGTLHRIDPESRQVTHTLDVGGQPWTLAEFGGDVWVAGGGGIVTRVSIEATDAEALEPPPVSEPPDLEDTTTPDLLPGVDLVTEEVEPGVYRVLSDGVRDLTENNRDVLVGDDGAVWVAVQVQRDADESFRNGRVVRLGSPGRAVRGPAEPEGRRYTFQSLPDGTITLSPAALVLAGDEWIEATSPALRACSHPEPRTGLPLPPDAMAGLRTRDGGCWAGNWRLGGFLELFDEDDEWRIGQEPGGRYPIVRADDDGSVRLFEWADIGLEDRTVPGQDAEAVWVGFAKALADDGTLWATIGAGQDRLLGLLRHDGETWEIVPFESAADNFQPNDMEVTPDGTVWLAEGDGFGNPDEMLASWDGQTWRDHGGNGGTLGVGPDGTLWIDGVSFVDGGEIRTLDLPAEIDTERAGVHHAADRSIWIASDGLYVVTADGVAAAVEQSTTRDEAET